MSELDDFFYLVSAVPEIKGMADELKEAITFEEKNGAQLNLFEEKKDIKKLWAEFKSKCDESNIDTSFLEGELRHEGLL